MTLPEKRTSHRPSALKRALSRFREEREEQRVAAMPSRFTRHRCAVTGSIWLTEWRPDSVGGRYKLYRKILDAEEIAEVDRATANRPATESEFGHFDMSEFEWQNPPCEGCGDNRFTMFCHHGFIVCGGRTIFKRKGSPLFRCDTRCGKQFPPGPGTVTQVAAETGQTERRKTLPNNRPKALPRQRRALPPARK